MSMQKKRGFTIIEVMLFLAITGALSVAILVGSSMAIGQQRYRDSVNSFKGHIQEQYGQIANVVNGEVDRPTCFQSGGTITFNTEVEQNRGTSDCLIIGRFLHVEPQKVTAYEVVGLPMATVDESSDTAAFQDYALTTRSPEERDIAWGARLVDSVTGDDISAGILILRSPLSGSIVTYIEDDSADLDTVINEDGDNHALATMVSDTNMVGKDFCVDPGGGAVTTSLFAVRIAAGAANQSAIEIPLEGENVCG